MLTLDDSDPAGRVARGLLLAEEAFGSRDKAHRRLHRNSAALGDRKAIDLFRTDDGARVLENLLARIAWGAAA